MKIHNFLIFLLVQPERLNIMVFCADHPKRDQNLKFTPLSETTSIPAPFIWEFPPGGGGFLQYDMYDGCRWSVNVVCIDGETIFIRESHRLANGELTRNLEW